MGNGAPNALGLGSTLDCAHTRPRLDVYWTSTRPLLDLYSPSTGPPTGPLLDLHWTSTGPPTSAGPPLGPYLTSTGTPLDLYWTSTLPPRDLHSASTGPPLYLDWSSTLPPLDICSQDPCPASAGLPLGLGPTSAAKRDHRRPPQPQKHPSDAGKAVDPELQGQVPSTRSHS